MRKHKCFQKPKFLQGGSVPQQYNPSYEYPQSPPTPSNPITQSKTLAGNNPPRTLPKHPK